MKYDFIAYTYGPKQKDPYTGEWNNKYLVPKVKDQKGKNYNYVVITCTPSMNGVYKYPAENVAKYGKWINGKTECLYVPIDDCDFCAFENLPESMFLADILKEVRKQQAQWYKGEVKNNPKKYPHGKPDWMITDKTVK